MIFMAFLYRLVALIFLFAASSASASSFAAIEYGTAINGPWLPSFAAACGSRNGVVINGRCMRSSRPSDSVEYPIFSRSAAACPANSSGPANACVCADGYTQNGGICEPKGPPDPCEGLEENCAGNSGVSKRFSMPGFRAGVSIVCLPGSDVTGTIGMFPNCSKGCTGVVSGTNEFNRKADGSWLTFGSSKGNGSTCDPAVIAELNKEKDPEYEPDPKPKLEDLPDAGCKNGQKGTIGGVSVCLPFSASTGVTQTETKDNGDGTKTDSKTEVKCENGKCQVTTSSTTTNNTTNNTVNSSSVTTTVDKADYCSKNKTAGVCKDEQGEEEGKGTFGGSCQGGFTCKGDAAMCAMAKEQHKRNCQMLEEDKDPASFINKAKNGTDGESAKAMQENASEIKIPTQLNKTGYGWPRSCPANTRIELGFVNASFEIPFDKLCGPLKIFSDIALAITALSLLVWLVFAGREKAGS